MTQTLIAIGIILADHFSNIYKKLLIQHLASVKDQKPYP
jgi:hypothetical protein